jgi:membrane protein YdbS with pleckstrin-like domain
MPEQTVWRGTPSQWTNFGRYCLSFIFCCIVAGIYIMARKAAPGEVARFSPLILLLLLVPVLTALARYLQNRNRIYELTTERLKMSQGVFTKTTDTLELYRVKDIETRQPFLYRMVGIENVQMNTSDTSSPFVLIEAIPSNVGLADKIRNQVETIRAQKGVREIDVE